MIVASQTPKKPVWRKAIRILPIIHQPSLGTVPKTRFRGEWKKPSGYDSPASSEGGTSIGQSDHRFIGTGREKNFLFAASKRFPSA